MDQLIPYDVIFFPTDGRPPSVVKLMTSPTHYGHNPGPRMPHPEAHMDFIAEATGHGAKPWTYLIVDALEGMNQKFTHPYIIFYPTISRDGMPFPINKCVRDIQGRRYSEQFAWRGNILIGKYSQHGQPFTSLMDASMADFPILKNFIMSRRSLRLQC
ncbi:hypothetical protein C8R43DRAFT_304378 [Mycena crocata]|nr:hypothetical protein C8R43DRAFT_304378 [Mycena crocata]